MLEPHDLNLAAVEQQGRVVQLPLFPPGGTGQHGRAAVSGFGGESLHGVFDAILERAFENQIFRRITAQRQFPRDHQIGAQFGGLGPGPLDERQIARDVADGRVDLGNGDGQGISHMGFGASGVSEGVGQAAAG